ncbi:protein PAT1 homolog 1-like [Saccoglossus kowalevskii]|uniref:Protein PAT1 homolog 1-like n=1 Tax=Saccoglossus kowalevskii TaxID=10224 RepID=A0ABM0MDA5_SACKO|nr:PREDICTED: protein PAT1 homolog 1-like [Saccoglossus kowalevskii]
MSASFFGFDTSGPPMEGEDTEEGDMTIEDVEGYDALNEDTFGCGATNDNWEATHEKFTQELHSFEEEGKANTTADSGFHTSDRSKTQEDDFMEQSITHLVLDDDDIDDPAIMMSSKSRPIATAHSPPSSLNRSLFSPSPPTLLDPTNLISPTQRSIWSSQRVPSPDEKLKSLLHIGEITLPPTLVDTAIVSAVHERSPSPPCFPQAITVEQLENLSPRTTPSRPIPMSSAMERDFASRVLPPRSVSPIIGSPPSTALPIGTPPKHYQYMTQQQMHHNTGPIPPHILHHMHQQIMRSGGRLSPTQLNQMIQEGRASPAAMTPPSMRLSLMSPRIPPPPHGALLPRGQVPSHMRSPGMRGGSSPPVGSNSPSQYRKGNDNPHYQRQQQYNQRQFYNHDRYHYVKNNNRQMYSDDRQRFPDSTNGVYDEYANLMTPKEKDWIIKIQMMQLQSNNPYLDDYYYQTFVLRKRAEVKKLNNEGIQTVKKDEPKIIMPPAKQSDARQYKPAHFEGTLGTVSVASVNNPRKMIDVKRAPSLQDDDLITSQPLKKRAVVLLSIEKVYSLLLELEDLEKKALALPDDESVNEERDESY